MPSSRFLKALRHSLQVISTADLFQIRVKVYWRSASSKEVRFWAFLEWASKRFKFFLQILESKIVSSSFRLCFAILKENTGCSKFLRRLIMFPKPQYCQAFLYCIWLSPSSECLHFKPAVCLLSVSCCQFVKFLNILINTAAPLASTDVCNNVNKFSWSNMQCLQQWHLDAPPKRANGNCLLLLQGAKLW